MPNRKTEALKKVEIIKQKTSALKEMFESVTIQTEIRHLFATADRLFKIIEKTKLDRKDGLLKIDRNELNMY